MLMITFMKMAMQILVTTTTMNVSNMIVMFSDVADHDGEDDSWNNNSECDP